MKPRRTHFSNRTFGLPGGNEDNDLWLHDDGETLASTWELDEDERRAIAAGHNIELAVWGRGHPPVSLRVVNHALGKPPVLTSEGDGDA